MEAFWKRDVGRDREVDAMAPKPRPSIYLDEHVHPVFTNCEKALKNAGGKEPEEVYSIILYPYFIDQVGQPLDIV